MRGPLLIAILVSLTGLSGCLDTAGFGTDSEPTNEESVPWWQAEHDNLTGKPEKRWEPVWTFIGESGDVEVTEDAIVKMEQGSTVDFTWDVSDLQDYEYPTDFIDYTLDYEFSPEPLAEGSAEDLPGSESMTMHRVAFHNFTLNYQDGQGLNKTQQITIQIGEPCEEDDTQWGCPMYGVVEEVEEEVEEEGGGSDVVISGTPQTFEGTWVADAPGCFGGTVWSDGANADYTDNNVLEATHGQLYHATFFGDNLNSVQVKFRDSSGKEIETHTTFARDPLEGEHPADATPVGPSSPAGPGLNQRGVTVTYPFQSHNTLTAIIPDGAAQVYFYSCGGAGVRGVYYETPFAYSHPRESKGLLTATCPQCEAGGANTGVGYRSSIRNADHVVLEILEEDEGMPFEATTQGGRLGMVFRTACEGASTSNTNGGAAIGEPMYGKPVGGTIPSGARCALMWDAASPPGTLPDADIFLSIKIGTGNVKGPETVTHTGTLTGSNTDFYLGAELGPWLFCSDFAPTGGAGGGPCAYIPISLKYGGHHYETAGSGDIDVSFATDCSATGGAIGSTPSVPTGAGGASGHDSGTVPGSSGCIIVANYAGSGEFSVTLG